MSGIANLDGHTSGPNRWSVGPAAQEGQGVVPSVHVRFKSPESVPQKQTSIREGRIAAEAPHTRMEAEIGREIIDLVPHWYEAACGPVECSIPIGRHLTRFYNHCGLTDHLSQLLEKISARTRELPLNYFVQLPGLTDVLLESFAIEWLRIHSATTDWTKITRYLEALARRTYENMPVALNLVIRRGKGTSDITQPHLQKFLDRLASSPVSYLAVDSELRLIEYGEVDWTQFKRLPPYKFHPDSLHPIHGIMEKVDLSAHLTAQGDIIVMNKAGLLAARRKRRWKLYEVETIKDSFSYCLGNECVGANLFEVVFDLSFRRQGALLIYDPEHRVRDRILNSESIVFSGWKKEGEAECGDCSGQSLVGSSIEEIAIGKGLGSLKWKRRLIEMACIDGAVVFDDDRLLAVGALIRSHPDVGNQLGARATAARSAYLWGAHPIKVSSDGDVTLYFKSKGTDDACDAVMQFL